MASMVYCTRCKRHTESKHSSQPYKSDLSGKIGKLVDVYTFVCKSCGLVQRFTSWRELRGIREF